MKEKPVLLRSEGGIAEILLNRPDNRNSMTPELLQGFSEAIDETIANSSVRVVVISGTGSCFSAGADFNSQVQLGDESLPDHERSYAIYAPFLRVLELKVPVIAALNGHAVGGGFALSLLCDIRIANRTAKYGANFTRLGLHPGLGISYLLPRLIGVSRANEMLFTGQLISGEEAARIALVSSALDSDKVMGAALSMAKTIAANAPVAVRLTKESIREHMAWDIPTGAKREAYAQAATLHMDDAKEGIAALLEKRDPQFHGK